MEFGARRAKRTKKVSGIAMVSNFLVFFGTKLHREEMGRKGTVFVRMLREGDVLI